MKKFKITMFILICILIGSCSSGYNCSRRCKASYIHTDTVNSDGSYISKCICFKEGLCSSNE